MDSILPSIISPEQLTETVVQSKSIFFMELVKLLSVAVNLHRLSLGRLSIDGINPVTIQQNVVFQSVSKKNVVKDLTLIYGRSLKNVEL
ncbi:unnamed protein product, partial [Adineta steineri]